MKNFLIYLLLLFLCLIGNAQNSDKGQFEFYLSAGGLLPGNVQGSYEYDFNPDETATIRNKVSPLIRFAVDYNLLTKLSVGLNINYSKFNIKDILYKGESMKVGNEVSLGTWEGREHIIPLDDIKMLETNLSVKWRFLLNEKMVLKPCMYVGFRQTFSGSPDAREKGVVVNYNFEFQYHLKKSSFILADLGFISQPYGGVYDIAYVRAFGIPYMTIGYGFKFM